MDNGCPYGGTSVLACNAHQEVDDANGACGSQTGDGKPHSGQYKEHYQKGRCKLVQLLKQMLVAAGIDVGCAGCHTGQKGRNIHG